MLNEQILSYIRQNVAAGYGKEEIKTSLMASGWSEGDIEAAFNAVGTIAIKPAPKLAVTEPEAEVEVIEDNPNVSELQRQANAEVARIENEAKRATERSEARQFNIGEKGIYGFLIKNNLAADKQSANVLLIVALVFVIGILYWIFLR